MRHVAKVARIDRQPNAISKASVRTQFTRAKQGRSARTRWYSGAHMQVSRCSLWVLCAALVLTVWACGEVKSNNTPDGGNIDPAADFTFSVDPTSLSIPIASSETVTVTVARTGTTGDIMLSASGLGANLTAEFSPAVIAEGSSTSQVTIGVKGGTPASTATITLTGTSANKTHSADVSVTSKTITVTGTVRGGRSGVTVGIIGMTSVTSGAGGVFTFANVTPPYDLYTFATYTCGSVSRPTVNYFDDLTRSDPTVSAATSCPPLALCGIIAPCPSASISGMKTGVGDNTSPVVFAWSEGSFNSGVLNTNGTFTGNASWTTGNTSTGYLHALQFTRKANGAPNTFLGYARAQAALTSGQAATNVTLNFNTVGSTGTISGSVNQPAGYPAPDVSLLQEFGNAQKSLWDATTSAIDASFPVVSTAGGSSLKVVAHLNDGVVDNYSYYIHPLTASATVNVTMPEAALLSTPAQSATGVTTTTPFTWTAPNGVISEVTATSSGTNPVAYSIFTTHQEVTLPSVPELPLPAGRSFTWRVNGYGPNSDINASAGVNELPNLFFGSYYTGMPFAYTQSNVRSFTTQ
jgi:hypothetical protein